MHCLTSNYLSRWYRYTITEIVAFQKKIEASIFAKQRKAEEAALSAWNSPTTEAAAAMVTADGLKKHLSVSELQSETPELLLALDENLPTEPKPRQKAEKLAASSLVTHQNTVLRRGADPAAVEASEEAVLAQRGGDLGRGLGQRKLQESGLADKSSAVAAILQEFHESAAVSVHSQWWDFFFEAAGTFRDMYKIVDTHTENFNMAFRYLTVPRSDHIQHAVSATVG